MKKILLILSISGLTILLAFTNIKKSSSIEKKPTICILGGTPSTADIVEQIPKGIKGKYNIISFNRPGFGGTPNTVMSKQKLFELARKAGLKKNDFGIIGVSGGGPIAILIAHEFKLSHCGVISGMVPREQYFAYADSTFTKPLMNSVLRGFDAFSAYAESFPNYAEILKQAGSPKDLAIRGCFDELNFLLSKSLFTKEIYQTVNVSWWHGAKDKNVALESVKLFLKNFKHTKLNIIPNGSHEIDDRIYVGKLIQSWENN